MFLFLFIVILISVVCSIFSMFRILVVFVFRIACSYWWCSGLVLVCFSSHFHVNESCVSCLRVFRAFLHVVIAYMCAMLN